jgi:precorrin-3B synthase
MNAPARKGWCPGTLRPMRTGDGLLVRLRIRAGVLQPSSARGIADCASRFGNGLLDLSGRGNLQLRGVTDETLPLLHEHLASLGLLCADEAVDSVLNIQVSPLAGLDPTMAPGILALARSIEQHLTGDAALHALPAKFGFLIDGGGVLPLDDIEADIALRALTTGRFTVEAARVAVENVDLDQAAEAAARWAHAFLRARRGDERRMREVVGRLVPNAAPARPLSARKALAGYHDLSEVQIFAAAAAFGRLTATQLGALADLAQEHRCELRLTPWRSILLAPVPEDRVELLAGDVASLGFLVDPSDPTLSAAACSGRPACFSGLADAQRDGAIFARALAPLLARGASLHVSGCTKGCARREPASFTLVAQQGGRYSLARDADASVPSRLHPLDPAAMASYLAALAHVESAETSDA